MDRYNTGLCPSCRTVTSVATTGRVAIDFDLRAVGHHHLGGAEIMATEAGTAVPVASGIAYVPCRGCGRFLSARRVLGRYRADKACGPRCESATGHQCECRCGGKNHGRAAG